MDKDEDIKQMRKIITAVLDELTDEQLMALNKRLDKDMAEVRKKLLDEEKP